MSSLFPLTSPSHSPLARTRFTVFPELRMNAESRQLCVNLKSSLAIPRSAEDNERLYEAALPFMTQCRPANHAKGFFWIGATDEAENGVWTDLEVGIGLYVSFSPFFLPYFLSPFFSFLPLVCSLLLLCLFFFHFHRVYRTIKSSP